MKIKMYIMDQSSIIIPTQPSSVQFTPLTHSLQKLTALHTKGVSCPSHHALRFQLQLEEAYFLTCDLIVEI